METVCAYELGQVYLMEVRRQMQDTNIHAYHNLHVVWGRKPFPGETTSGVGGRGR